MIYPDIVFVQLGEVWGDEADTLGLDSAFLSGARAYATSFASAAVVMPSDDRISRIRSGMGSLTVLSRSSTDVVGLGSPEVIIALHGARRQDVRDLDGHLRAAGYKRAGRPWGAAGETRRYVRPRTVVDGSRVLVAETRVLLGALLVRVRDQWLDRSRFAALRERFRVMMSRHLSAVDTVDHRFGRPYPPVGRVDVRDLLPDRSGVDLPPWSVGLDDEPAPDVAAHECYERHRVWPVSFSYPGVALPLLDSPKMLVAPIVPGLPYSFTDADAYLETYRSAYLGLTHRKAGWDCFRHVEIMASGAVPLMPDVDAIPGYSMVHYPKGALERVANLVRTTGAPPDERTRIGFRQWFERHLTSKAMARFILEVTGLGEDARVLFVDERLPRHADYQSVLTLIGLKQLLGKGCDVLFPTDYIYDDTTTDTTTLYGRGFGYTRCVAGSSRSSGEQGKHLDPADFDAVVIGSITRNATLAQDLLRFVPPARTIWIQGEDQASSAQHAHDLRNSGSHVFMRSIHAGSK